MNYIKFKYHECLCRMWCFFGENTMNRKLDYARAARKHLNAMYKLRDAMFGN